MFTSLEILTNSNSHIFKISLTFLIIFISYFHLSLLSIKIKNVYDEISNLQSKMHLYKILGEVNEINLNYLLMGNFQ